jgi:hypothetical protein
MGTIHYRAVHTHSPWRRVNTHRSLAAAVHGKDGAAALFSGRARINYARHGEPRFVVVWEDGAAHGMVVRRDPASPGGIRVAQALIDDLLCFESAGQATDQVLGAFFQ